ISEQNTIFAFLGQLPMSLKSRFLMSTFLLMRDPPAAGRGRPAAAAPGGCPQAWVRVRLVQAWPTQASPPALGPVPEQLQAWLPVPESIPAPVRQQPARRRPARR